MREIKISEILNLLDKGYTRDMLKEYYSLTNKEIKNLFTHPKLRGLKAKKAMSFEIVDDTEETPEAVMVQETPATFTYEAIAQDSEIESIPTSESIALENSTIPSWGDEPTYTEDETQEEILLNN